MESQSRRGGHLPHIPILNLLVLTSFVLISLPWSSEAIKCYFCEELSNRSSLFDCENHAGAYELDCSHIWNDTTTCVKLDYTYDATDEKNATIKETGGLQHCLPKVGKECLVDVIKLTPAKGCLNLPNSDFPDLKKVMDDLVKCDQKNSPKDPDARTGEAAGEAQTTPAGDNPVTQAKREANENENSTASDAAGRGAGGDEVNQQLDRNFLGPHSNVIHYFGKTAKICMCEGDLCNGGAISRPSFVLILAFVAARIVLFY